MARKPRVEFEGAIHHVMNRGVRQEPVFRDNRDREGFMEALEECCGKTDRDVHARCPMPNHFHRVGETPQPNPVEGMKWLPGTHIGRFNPRHKVLIARRLRSETTVTFGWIADRLAMGSRGHTRNLVYAAARQKRKKQ